MANRRFELFVYRQLLVRIRRGDSDRDIGRGKLAGRKKIAKVRHIAEELGWLDCERPLPDDAAIAEALSRGPTLPSSCASSLEPYRDQIVGWFQAEVQGTTILGALRRNHGYSGSYSSVRRFLRHLAGERGVAATTILDFPPGDAAQVDFGAGPVLEDASDSPLKTWIFVMTLCWSRHQYAEIVLDQTTETWLACHRRAFEWFGGCPGRIIIDNAKCAISRACMYDPEVQRSYAGLAEGYGFKIDACPPHDPQKKGIVESGVKYVKKSFVPLRDFRNLPDANRQLREWIVQEAATRQHGTTREQPSARFAIEKTLLGTLPDVPPILAAWATVMVHRDAHIQYKNSLYSVPFSLVGKRVWLKSTDTIVQIFHQHELVATHPRQSKSGSRSTIRDHQPPAAQAWLQHDPQWCLTQAKEIGNSCHALIIALLNDKILVNLRAAQGIVRLRGKVDDVRIEAACERAIAFGSPRWRTVKMILDKGLDSQPLPEPQHALADTYASGGRFGRNLQSLLLH